MINKIKAYIDLTRAHFIPAWPLLFSSGLFFALQNNYGAFSWSLLIRVALIGLFGMEAGLVLNDFIDRDLDKKDKENTLTKYWRPFGNRPLSKGLISAKETCSVMLILMALTTALIFTLPISQALSVFFVMLYCYGMEIFYQLQKRKQNFPWAQIIGRTDFALFPVAGYVTVGQFDLQALSFFLFFYPLALAHLGMNDILDIKNDLSRKLYSIPILYGVRGTQIWIAVFTALHYIGTLHFIKNLSSLIIAGFTLPLLLLFIANLFVIFKPEQKTLIKVLPLFHVTMALYALLIIADFFI